MDKSIASNAVFARVSGMLEELGFTVTDVAWRFGMMADANVRLGNRRAARLDFAGYGDHVRLLVHPVDPSSHQILAGSGRVHLDERLDKEIDDIEALFRTLLVKKKKLSYAEYPTDFALKRWIGHVARISVPRDGVECKFHAKSEVSIRSVELARRLEVKFDRETALRFHVFAADYDVPVDQRGYYLDEAVGNIRDAAITCSDTRYGRHALAWQTGSSGSYLFMAPKPAPLRPELDLEENIAPAMAM